MVEPEDTIHGKLLSDEERKKVLAELGDRSTWEADAKKLKEEMEQEIGPVLSWPSINCLQPPELLDVKNLAAERRKHAEACEFCSPLLRVAEGRPRRIWP